jgi:excisionase family DNA binding protein
VTTAVELPEWLTVGEVARIARISRRHAYALVESGQIPSVRLGRAIRIPRAKLLELLRADAAPAEDP